MKYTNGIRDDNRPENLELWTGRHGKGVRYKDANPSPIGKWTLDIYKGDVRREAIPLGQRLWNLYADIRWKLFKIPSSHYFWGKVLNEQVGQLSGSNRIVTVGKQMIMDRLFGLSAVGAMTRIGVGTSATGDADGNTSLTGGVFVAYDATPIRTSLTVACIATFGTGTANISWNEIGMDNSTTLLSRIAPIGPFNKTSAVSIVVTYSVTQA